MSENLNKKKYLALILVMLLIGLALVTVWSKDPLAVVIDNIQPTSTINTPTATTPPTETTTPTATFTATPQPTSPPTQLPPTFTPIPTAIPEPPADLIIHGEIALGTEMVGGKIHEIYIKMSEQITVEVIEIEDGYIQLLGQPPWVNVEGAIDSTGEVVADGVGTVADYPGVTVVVTGTLTSDYFDGTLTMGANDELPGGEAGVYTIRGPYTPYGVIPSPGTDITASLTITFDNYLSDFNQAMQNVDVTWLYDNLHPVVIERYDPNACREYLNRTVQPEFEITVESLSGPDVWSWESQGVIIDVEDAYTAYSKLIIKGNLSESNVHFALVDGQFRWFTTCLSADE